MIAIPVLRSKLALGAYIALLFGGLALAVIAVLVFLHRPSGAVHRSVTFILAVLSIISLIKFLSIEVWVIDDNRVVIKNLLGFLRHSFKLAEIQWWEESETSAWGRKCCVLILHTAKGDAKLVSVWYSNYYPIRALVCFGKPGKMEG